MRKLLFELDFRLGDDSRIEDDSHIFGALYYSDILKCIQFLLARLPFEAHLNLERVRLADYAGCGISSEINTGDWWLDT
jgi:hypothetical protein